MCLAYKPFVEEVNDPTFNVEHQMPALADEEVPVKAEQRWGYAGRSTVRCFRP